HPRLLSLDGLPLANALALATLSDMFLGVDSCMLHMADVSRVPGVGLFGPAPDDPLGAQEVGFRLADHLHISGEGSMTDVKVPDVLNALERIAGGAVGSGLPRRHRGR